MPITSDVIENASCAKRSSPARSFRNRAATPTAVGEDARNAVFAVSTPEDQSACENAQQTLCIPSASPGGRFGFRVDDRIHTPARMPRRTLNASSGRSRPSDSQSSLTQPPAVTLLSASGSSMNGRSRRPSLLYGGIFHSVRCLHHRVRRETRSANPGFQTDGRICSHPLSRVFAICLV